jgi:N-methylhydantoinase A
MEVKMGNLQRLRFAIDTGGTFTDIVVLDEDTGNFRMDKVPTTPSNVLIGTFSAIEKAKLDLANIEKFFIHGSTMAMNCLLERKGTKTAFVATKGFRDVPEIARYDRPELYNIKYKRPPSPVPRDLAFEVSERVDYKGNVLVDLDIEDVRRVARILKKKKVESVAVCFLHAFKKPAHERKAKEIILEEYPEVSVSISSDIVSEHREYERSMTVILDAYLKSTVQAWVGAVEQELTRRGFKGRVIITRSDGGGMTSELAMENPVNTLLSGPAGGVIGGLYYANNLNRKNLVTIDMGGTSCDVCMIKDGEAMVKYEARIGDWRILIPTMSINTIGAGGGSIAWIDTAGVLHVGPQSAGASPGPICYAQGGVEPTITDAALVNGYIDPGYFLGGEIPLHLDSAKSGIENKVGKALDMDLQSASSGMLRIASSNMAEAIKGTTVDQGEDVREFELLCYGGAGPLFGAYLIGELGMPAAIIPIAPAAFSAWGMLMIDIRHDFSQTVAEALDRANLSEINNILQEMVKRGEDTLASEKIPAESRMTFTSLDMRYADQEHTVNVPIDFVIDQKAKDRIYEEFTKVYKRVWGYTLEGQPAAIRHLRVTSIGKIPKPKLAELQVGTRKPDAALKGNRRVFCFMDRKWANYSVYDRSKLLANNLISGPALIEEPTCVITVPQGYQCEVDKVGNLIITKKEG